MCEDMKEVDVEFPSYSNLSKRRLVESPIKFQTKKGDYSIFVFSPK